MTFGKCSNCGEFALFLDRHTCPPLWRVRIPEDSKNYNDEDDVTIHARDAELAAEKFAEQ